MKPDSGSNTFLAITRSKAKMYEYFIPESDHIAMTIDPARLFLLTIGILGDLSARYARGENIPLAVTKELVFSARFFDAYLRSHLKSDLDPYLILLGATSYYLCELPGSSMILANEINNENLDLDCDGIEKLLLWLLQGNFGAPLEIQSENLSEKIREIYQGMVSFASDGIGEEELFNKCLVLRKQIYKNGTPRQLLIVDSIYSVVKKKYENSTWYSLPLYSNLTKDQWSPILKKDGFIKELWPAQHLLGKEDIYRGRSAVVQMPTSAGKTKSTEIIIRSAFIAERTSLAVIVAPFRALCHEIKDSLSTAFNNEQVDVDELTDVLQADFDFENLSANKKILITTPEKLLYILRHNSEIGHNIGLLILDEGHQFDSGIRGVTYELLLTSLRSLLPSSTQKVIISAVIGNAESINAWFNGSESVVVSGSNLTPTFRSIGFVSWLDSLGQVHYVSNSNIDNGEFFVPRVIESLPLEKKTRERNDRLFPSKNDGKTTALYLGLKLVPNGGVAIFCGTKQSASNISKTVVDIFNRGVTLTAPVAFSDQTEVRRLSDLYKSNLGEESIVVKSAELGIFSHDGNTPHGIRLAVEHAMHEGKIRFVVCTSTLAQGVNLPIRYLIVDGLYQGSERIKTRDFHNLIGRAGRSGMHTEGSILFADPLIYDRKRVRRESWRWREVKKLIDSSNAEPCVSNLLSLFDPIESDDKKYSIKMDPMTFVNMYIDNPNAIADFSRSIVADHSDHGFSESGVGKQITWKMNIISAIESFLMFNWIDDEEEDFVTAVRLGEETLAYSLADDSQKEQLRILFKSLSQNIIKNITDPDIKKIYGKTLYGMWDAKEIESWVNENIENLLTANTEELIDLVWPLLSKHIRNNAFNKCNQPEAMKELFGSWINGVSFKALFDNLESCEASLIWGTKFRKYQVDHVVDICENGLAYDGSLLLGAIIEFIENRDFENRSFLTHSLQNLQKRLKYGLPSVEAVILYEMGFSDRIISQEMAAILGEFNLNFEARSLILENLEQVNSLFESYPSYYVEVLKRYI